MKQPWKLWERNYTALLAIRYPHKSFVTIVMYIMWFKKYNNVFIREINYLIYLFEQISNFILKKKKKILK